MLATICGCHHRHGDLDVNGLSARERCYGIVAHRWVLRKGKGCRRRVLPAVAKRKSRNWTLIGRLPKPGLIRFRSWKTTPESLTTGRTSSHGPPSPANSSPPFSCPDPPSAFEASARKKNSSTCSIWCQSTHRSSLHTTRPTLSRSIPSKASTAHNTDRVRDTTTTKGPLFECFHSSRLCRPSRALFDHSFILKILFGALFIVDLEILSITCSQNDFYVTTRGGDLWSTSKVNFEAQRLPRRFSLRRVPPRNKLL